MGQICHGRVDHEIGHDHVEVRSPVRIVDGDGMISCVVEDCDELTKAACQSLVMLNDDGWSGIALNDGKVVG